MVIARTEALIAGWGMEEALRRGRAYADAGADMVLIHSKSKDPDEVLSFAKLWDRPNTPLVCVPTIYRTTKRRDAARGGLQADHLREPRDPLVDQGDDGDAPDARSARCTPAASTTRSCRSSASTSSSASTR